jgi:hypothetical protein
MRGKSYDTRNVLHAGFMGEQRDSQGMTLKTPLSEAEATMLEDNGFIVEENHISFKPENATDLGTIK